MPIETFKRFFRYEASAGILLFVTAMLALIIDNTGLSTQYQHLWRTHLHIALGSFVLDKPLLLWVNDGFMAIFFLLVGLEVKREMTVGELSSLRDAVLPAAAAVGGMVIPALVYVALTYGQPHLLRGWAIPAATDIAFSLGVLALLTKRIPTSVKVFLTALAIFDDIGAIIIIAIFYTSKLSFVMLISALIACVCLIVLNRMRVQSSWPYIFFGWILWLCVLKSGVHATLAGVILAFTIPLKQRDGDQSSMLETWEEKLHPWVAYLVLPIFAFANAGINFGHMHLSALWSGISLACILGLFIGKQVGITGASWLALKAGWAKWPEGTNLRAIWGVSLVAGIGFTMSLFIGSLAFAGAQMEVMNQVRLGVIVGSLISGLAGYWCLRRTYK